MTVQSQPSSEGTYRIKLVDQNSYIESVPSPNNPGLKLSALDTTSAKQKWILKKASQANAWTITSANDNWGLTYTRNQDTYWGYGYPHPQNSTSLTWSIISRTSEGKSFSKIQLLNDSYSFDSVSPGSDAVHFYYDKKNYSDGPKQCYVFEPVSDPGSGGKPLDVLFLQDFTGSQQSYINRARDEIETTCATLAQKGNLAPGDLRFGVVAFRDYPPQDKTFITKALTPVPGSNPEQVTFTTDPGKVASVLTTLTATGGGDGPEAQSDALQMAVQAQWNTKATKVAILITDSPPHGIGEKGDGFPNAPDGTPSQIEPQRMAKAMARLGITLYVVACEPTLSGYYDYARGFYEGLVQITGGRVLELGSTINISQFILGAAIETVDHEAVLSQYSEAVRSLVKQNSNASNAEIAQKLQTQLAAKNVKMRTLNFDNVVPEDSMKKAAQVWFETDTLKDARAKLKNVNFTSRMLNDSTHNYQIKASEVKNYYAAGGSQPAPEITVAPISLSQVAGIVQKYRMRN
ncbi:hypothetical protein APHAL10511_005841 [Amanita phalloides]|nr:hypothetical protein APHAL10511_005841 [Amanita phalloides]